MAPTTPTTKQLAERAQLLEKQLATLAEQGPSLELAAKLQEYRLACEDIILGDFEYAQNNGVQAQLWATHLRVSSLYRSELHNLKKGNSNRVVEFRKLAKQYWTFIKASQSFYRQFIVHLDAEAGGIPELRKVAQQFKSHGSANPPRSRIPPHLKTQVTRTCGHTLIQLGDLSRYRETELTDKTKDRNWGPAKGFYKLAAEIIPSSGAPHHQLAILAREDGDHFRSTYYLYRSLASEKPHPNAKGNLSLEFKKIVTAWNKGELINNLKSSDGKNVGVALVAWFVRLHSKCFKGEEFAQHDELENEVLSQLTVELKERSLDSILQKIVLINLAAEYFATVQLQSAEETDSLLKSYSYYLRLNVKTFFTLLQILQAELERISGEGDDVTRIGDHTSQLSDKITAVARRVLPALRLYSTWFFRTWPLLMANLAHTLTTVEVQELWKAYAGTLTLLASSFPPSELPQDDYLLQEDVDTIGFQPLTSEETMSLWYYNDGGKMKPKCGDIERSHPNIEMLMRVRDFLITGLKLTQLPEAPLDLDGMRFIYREAGLPSELLASPNNRPDGSPRIPVESMDLPLFPQETATADDQKSYSAAPPSETTSTNLARDSALNQMVDDLVGAEDGLDPLQEEDEDLPPTPPETFEDTMATGNQFANGPINISDLVNSVTNYKKPTGSPAPATPLLSVPMGRVASSSSIRQPAALPSIPDGQYNVGSIWNTSYNGTPAPSSPLPINGQGMNRSPIHDMHLSGSFGHVRGDSSNSLRSNDWGYASGSSSFPRPAPGGMGNGAAWGNPAAGPTAYNPIYGNNPNYSVYGNNSHYNRNSNADLNLASPLLFGRGSWDATNGSQQMHSSYHRTPPNGQGG